MKLSADGARVFSDAFDRAQQSYGGGMFREGRSFQKAYLLDLLQEMLQADGRAGCGRDKPPLAACYAAIDTRSGSRHGQR